MGRLGLPWVAAETPAAKAAVVTEIQHLAGLDGLSVEGIFTHFANADRLDKTDSKRQLRSFQDLLDRLDREGIELPLRHAANSAALIDLPASHLDMVRAGIATYGLDPSAEISASRIGLEPVLGWKTRIIQLKEVPTGFAVSYGSTWRTTRPTTLATIAVGYADGLARLLSSTGRMLVGGRPVPIVGRVCMDLTVLDLGSDSGAQVGDEVVIIGRQGDNELSAESLADTLGTINYEIVTSISARVPRIYHN
jgi:alanine racemase